MKSFVSAAGFYLGARSIWLVADLFMLMVCEKWIQLLTHNATFIIMAMLVYYVFIYGVSWLIKKGIAVMAYPKRLSAVLLLGAAFFSLIAWIHMGSLDQKNIAIGWIYGLMATGALLSVVTNTCLSMLMDTRVHAELKPRLLSMTCMVMGLVGALAYFIGATWLIDQASVYLFLMSAAVLYVMTYVLIVALSNEAETEIDIVIEEYSGSMRASWMAPVILFGLFFLFELFYSCLDPLHTIYVADILKQGQEVQFQFLSSMFIGIILIALLITTIFRKVSLYGVFFIFFGITALYLSTLLLKLPLMYLFIGVAIVAASANLLSTAIMIYLHHHYSNEKLGRYLLILQQIQSTGPCLAVVLVLIGTHFGDLSAEYLIVIFLIGATLCSVLLIAMIISQSKKKEQREAHQ